MGLNEMSMNATGTETAESSATAEDTMPATPENSLQILGVWINMYSNIDGKYPASVDDLSSFIEKEELDKYKLYKNPETGEEKPFLYAPVVDPKEGVAVPFLATPEPDADGKVTVQFSDMEQRKVPLAEFKKIWPRAKK
jgi:hypothetical protein